MIKSKTESPTMRLKTLLLKLSEYTIDLKYQKGSEMHTSDALGRLHNFTDTPDQKDIIPLNFLQHFTPHYIEHSYSHLVENLYAHKTKTLDATTAVIQAILCMLNCRLKVISPYNHGSSKCERQI